MEMTLPMPAATVPLLPAPTAAARAVERAVGNALTLTHHPHPLLPAAGRETHMRAWRYGETVRETLVRCGFDVHQEIVIGLNDRLLTVAEWDIVLPQPGDIINVHVAVSGGDDGSNPLAVVASLALSFFAPGIGEAINLALFDAGSSLAFAVSSPVLGAVVSIAGNAVINAIFKPTSGALDRASNVASASPTYSLSGGRNALRPYEPLPIILGRHRIHPDYGARPFTQFSGRDQYLYQIFNFGVSSITLEDYRIGNTPISAFSDIAFYWPDADGRITAFPGNVDTTSGGEIKAGAGWVMRTTSPDTIRIAADIEGMIVYADPEDGPQQCQAIVEAQYAVADSGAWQTLSTTTVQSWGTHYWSLGRYITGDYGDPTWEQSGYGSTSYGEHTEGDTQSVAVGWGWEGTIYATCTWRWRPYAEILTNGNGSALKEPAPAQPITYVDLAERTIPHGAAGEAQRTTFERNVPKGQYDVRIRLTYAGTVWGLSIGDGNAYGRAQYSFSQLRSYQDDPASYKGQARLGLVIKASGQLNGVLDTFSALATAYCSVWTGSAWEWKPTSNPAWWFLDVARGRYNADGKLLYGAGLPAAQVDVEGIKAWAAFCDAHALTCNAVIDRRVSVNDLLSLIARCGLASPSWGSGKLGVVWDQPNASPVMVFGMGNIARGSFSVEYLTENMADEIVVSFIDESRDWQQQQVRVLVPGVTSPERTTTLDLMGCTNAAMAGKFANVIAAQQYYRRRTITWETDFEGFICTRGDVVLLSHDLTQWGYSGRIVAVDGNVVTLDRAVPRSSVDYLMLRRPDGEAATYTVAAGTGDSDTLTLAEAPDLQEGTLPLDHLWVYSPLATPGKRVKIISVAPVSESRVRIVATDEDPAFYAAWNGTWSQPAQNTLLRDMTPRITRIDITETLAMLATGVVGSRLAVTFTTDTAFDSIDYRWRIGGGPWNFGSTGSGTATLETLVTGRLEISARPFFGVLIGYPFSASQYVAGKSLPPASVAGFALAAIGGQAHLSWVPSADLDVQIGGSLRLRHAAPGQAAEWSNGIDIGPAVPGTSAGVVLPLLAGTYMAKWVDSVGLESPEAALIITDAPGVISGNAVVTVTEHDAFAGAKTSMAVSEFAASSSGSALMLDSALTVSEMTGPISTWGYLGALGDVAESGVYEFAGNVDLGAVFTSRLTALIESYGFDASDLISSRGPVATWSSVGGGNVTDATVQLQVRTTNDDPGGAPAWSAWQPFFTGDWTARAFEFRLLASRVQQTHNVAVGSLAVTVDMPDRIYSGDDIACPAGGMTVTFPARFYANPAVGITAQGMATGDYYTIAKTEEDFDIQFFNAAAVGVARTFDYIARSH